MIRQQQTQIQALQSTSHGGSAVVDDSTPPTPQAAVHTSSGSRSRSPFIPHSGLSRNSSYRSNRSSTANSPSIIPLSGVSDGNELQLGPSATRDESAFYQAETQTPHPREPDVEASYKGTRLASFYFPFMDRANSIQSDNSSIRTLHLPLHIHQWSCRPWFCHQSRQHRKTISLLAWKSRLTDSDRYRKALLKPRKWRSGLQRDKFISGRFPMA